MEKVWVVKDTDEYLKPRAKQRIREEDPPPRITEEVSPPDEVDLSEVDPALAYTLSLLFWGAGQLYNGQRTKGLNFIGLALFSNALAILVFMFQEELPSYLFFFSISPAQAVLAAALLLFVFMIFWVSNASDAYHTAIKARRTPFTGVKSRVYPLFGSLLVPGWGQFLNGQPVKGALFAICAAFGVFSLISVLGILQVWPSLENSDSRLIVEVVLLLALLSLPTMPVLWILGVFDAWKVGQDDIKKEPLLERLKAANNRRRSQGWVRGVFPQIKRTLLFAFFLIIMIIITVQFYFPGKFYREYLMKVLSWSSKQGMMFIPELIRGIIAMLPMK